MLVLPYYLHDTVRNQVKEGARHIVQNKNIWDNIINDANYGGGVSSPPILLPWFVRHLPSLAGSGDVRDLIAVAAESLITHESDTKKGFDVYVFLQEIRWLEKRLGLYFQQCCPERAVEYQAAFSELFFLIYFGLFDETELFQETQFLYHMLLEWMRRATPPPNWLIWVSKRDQQYYIWDYLHTKGNTDTFNNEMDWTSLIREWKTDSLDTLVEALRRILAGPRGDGMAVVTHREEYFVLFAPAQHCANLADGLRAKLRTVTGLVECHRQILQSYALRDSLSRYDHDLIYAHHVDHALRNMAEGLTKYLPFQRSAIFSVSSEPKPVFSGIFGHVVSNQDICDIYEKVGNVPPIQEAVEKEIPVYVPDSAAKGAFPEKYVQQFQLHSVVIVPLTTHVQDRPIGVAIIDRGQWNRFTLGADTFAALKHFGERAGEALVHFIRSKPGHPCFFRPEGGPLSPREVDVLQLLANGKSVKEIAGELQISPYTVQDHVASLMKKLHASSRAQAVAEGLRAGWIK